MKRILSTILIIITLNGLFLSEYTFAAQHATIGGRVTDGHTGRSLPGATVFIVGTRLGASTDLNGRFIISDVPAGNYTLRATYIGYSTSEKHVRVAAGANLKIAFKLMAVGVRGKEVVVTAQAAGQNAAINQQLSSHQIVNVVSAAKIRQLPDANAAESLGRLPGVSVLRSGGEGYEVVIRGMQPKYNEIKIDGVEMASSNPYNRSTDLSMITSNMLDGIEVYKTVTANMDANTIGGTVNFEMREAKTSATGGPLFGGWIQGGYNNLPDAYNKFNNYKYVGTAEDRFLSKKFGVFAQFDIERRNLTSNELGASYDHLGGSTTQYITTGLNLYDIPRDRLRYNAAVNLDYRLPEGKITFTNFLSSGNTNTLQRDEAFTITGNTIDYQLSNSVSRLTDLIDALDFKQKLSIFELDANLSQAYSETRDPMDWTIDFLQTSAGINGFINKATVNPREIPITATYNIPDSYLNTIESRSTFSRARALTGSLDLKTNVNISDVVSMEVKFGGEYRYQSRSFTNTQYDGQSLISGSGVIVDSLINSHLSLPQTTQISMSNFIDPSFSYGTFLNGDYRMVAPLNLAMLSKLADFLNGNTQYIAKHNGAVSYGLDNLYSTTSNYTGYENRYAFYLMPIINIGPQLNIIAGVRYQDLRTTYTAPRGIQSVESWYAYDYYDTTVTRNHPYWFPDLSLKYEPVSWFNMRLSYSNTVAYPDYDAIIPRINVASTSISWVNFKLLPSRATNYDAYFSFYSNTIGLFTAGAFLKQIDNLIYPWTSYASGASALQYYPSGLTNGSKTLPGTMAIYTYVNDSYKVNDYGIELDWQTHFWYLPGVLSGLVLGANYTHIFSRAQYPYTEIRSTGRYISYIDTSFTNRLIDQPDEILNLSLGFDYKGFSIRVAMLYQSDIFTGADFWPQLRSYTAPYTRWDLAAKQDLPWHGLQVFLDVNNITGANDVSIIRGGGVPIAEQDYGTTADLGLRLGI